MASTRSSWLDGLSLDVRSLAAFRMCLATLCLCDIGVRFGDATAFYSDEGVLPRASLAANGLPPTTGKIAATTRRRAPLNRHFGLPWAEMWAR